MTIPDEPESDRSQAPRPLTAEAQARIAQDAASLDERIAALSRARAPAPTEVLRPWVQAFCPDTPGALLHRLEWDGLDLATVLQAAAEPAHPLPLPDWIVWLSRFASEAERLADEEGAPAGSGGAAATLPFEELWRAVGRAARARLEERARESLEVLAPAALEALERQLMKEAASVAEQAAYEQFRGFLERRSGSPVGDAGSQAHYAAFVRESLQEGLAALFADHPVAARLLAVLAESWVAAACELVERLAADGDALAESFGNGSALGGVESIDAGRGDRHHGGRRVMVLTFTRSRRLVYKPRDVGVERAYGELLDWISREGLEGPRSLRVLERPGYGWVEYAEPGGFLGLDDARRYHRRSGALLCLAYVLRGRDLHMENVVASREGPHLVDTEMLLQPEAARPGGDGGSRAEDSFLGTGLLSMIQGDESSGVFDIGGLRGDGGGRAPIARRVWKALGTDAIHFVRDPWFEPAANNRVLLDGVAKRPEDFAEDVASGFAETYRFLRARAEALLAAGGPLSGFAGKPVRVLFRTSTQYGALQYVLTAPQYQRSGLRRSFALDALNRNFATEVRRPVLWPLVADERRGLERLDIPRFTVESTATTVYSETGEPVSEHFVRSGFEAVAARLRTLSEEDLEDQVAALRLALGSSVRSRFATAPPESSGEAVERPLEAALMDHALWVGRELVAQARGGFGPSYASQRRGAGPLHLYDGATGRVLFLAALAAVTGEDEWEEAAQAALAPIAGFFERRDAEGALGADEMIGGASGLASIAYALGVSSRFLADEPMLELALRIARLVTPRRIEADLHLDVVGGSAGAALALVALHRISGEGWLKGRAAACARRLADAAVAQDGGALAWPAVDGRRLAGFAHGAAGIACALAQVALTTGDDGLLEKVRAAYRYERSLFSEAHGNWPVLVKGKGPTPAEGAMLMVAWCHGAPGVGLGRALALSAVDDEEVSAEIEAAMRTTGDAPSGGGDHLCCGRLGRADVLLTVGERLGRTDWVEAARSIAADVCARGREERRFVLPFTEFEYRVFDPGFFRGLSGIGYALLRVADPPRVPSILGWQVPAITGGKR